MASGKEDSDAFNLLKLYQDEDDDMEDPDGGKDEGSQIEPEPRIPQLQAENREDQKSKGMYSDFPGPVLDVNPMHKLDSMAGIVDLGHDEAAMSPEVEEGAILSNAEVMHGEVAKNAHAVVEGKALSGNVWLTTPTIHSVHQPSVRVENSEYDAADTASIGFEKEDLDNFLPPPPSAKCSKELQEKINKFLAYMRQGISFNAEVRKRKDYRNPDFLLQAVSYQDIDQIGSCFSKNVFDPHGYDESDYFDAIEADMKREMERKEQAKKSPMVESVSGGSGTQLAAIIAAAKISMSVSGGLQSASAEAMHREVDGDRQLKTSVAAHATILSTTNPTSVQQRLRERKSVENQGREGRS